MAYPPSKRGRKPRDPGQQRKMFTIEMTENEYLPLIWYAARADAKVSAIVREAVYEYLERRGKLGG